MNRKKRSVASNHRLIESLESRQLLSSSANLTISPSLILDAASSSGSIEGYTPAQIKTAYGITGTGAGQTIAIVDAYSDPNIASDLAVFDKEFDLAAPPSFIQESAKGSTSKLPAENADWDSEISLDVEWAHAIAPDAKIILVDASSDSMSGLMSAVEFARTITTVSVISMSWGGSEFAGEASYDQYFTTPSGHIGITFVAASGDDGAAGGADYPAASPNVVSVGGTTLELSSTGAIESQTAWSDSEGGVSEFEPTPSYQSSIASSGRSTPDVSYDADPNTGVAVYDSVSDDGYVGWQEVGGTSAGTPQWASIIAIADQDRVANGVGTLTSNQTLTELYSVYSNATSYANDFSDITSGSSVLSEGGGFGGPFGGGPFGGRGRGREIQYVYATAGYDTLTGLGTPKAGGLIKALASAQVSSSSVKATAVSGDKSVKTKAAAAIEIKQVASVFGVAADASTLTPIQRDESNIEIETTASTTTAAAITAAKPGATGALAVGRPEFSVENQTPSAQVDSGAAATGTLVADASASARTLVNTAAVEMAELGARISSATSSVSALPGLFGETVVAKDFRDALNEFAQACAAPAAAQQQRQSSSSTMFLEGLAITTDAVLIGYYYSKRKRRGGGDLFNDQRII